MNIRPPSRPAAVSARPTRRSYVWPPAARKKMCWKAFRGPSPSRRISEVAVSKPLDVLLVTPPSRVQVYQELSRDFAAIEPPVWAGLIATFLRRHSGSVAILDAEAQGLNHEQTAEQIAAIGPRLAVFVIYGQQ